MASLEERVQRLEDESAIKVLKGRYCEYCDNAYDPDGIASLFVEAGIWDGGFMGRFEGRDAIREHFAGTSAVMGFAIHHVTNPIIEVDGDRARGQWYLWQPCSQTGRAASGTSGNRVHRPAATGNPGESGSRRVTATGMCEPGTDGGSKP